MEGINDLLLLFRVAVLTDLFRGILITVMNYFPQGSKYYKVVRYIKLYICVVYYEDIMNITHS